MIFVSGLHISAAAPLMSRAGIWSGPDASRTLSFRRNSNVKFVETEVNLKEFFDSLFK